MYEKLNEENANNIVEAPYLVLLDEANLSPIEFYWSNLIIIVMILHIKLFHIQMGKNMNLVQS